ncbi:MAG: AAA family ATPase [Candidatus Saccharimonadales bacterium]
MPEPLLHPKTKNTLARLVAEPPQALLLVGKKGVGKQTVASSLAANLLGVAAEALGNHPYFLLVGDAEGSIPIETVRDVQHFLSRKTTSTTLVSRVVTIIDADRLTPEAQSAFLKTLEEPPQGSVLVMTVSDKQRLLPTIFSRLQSVDVTIPDVAEAGSYFESAGYKAADIARAILMSGGLPGLMTSMLEGEQNHPLVKAADTARTILRLDTFGRLALIDTLSKQRQQCMDVCYILQQMAELSLRGAGRSASVYKQWHTVLRQAHDAERALLSQAQPKLVLTHLMLSL